jgi:hypothetical protein
MTLDVHRIEATFGIKPRNWQREIERRLEAGIVPQPGDRSLAAAGYPELYRTTIFLGDAGLDRWEHGRHLLFPPICCVCAAPAEIEIAEAGSRIPHCREHGAGRASLMIESGAAAPKAMWITLTGRNDEFLQQAAKANSDGDMVPPWEAFPQYDSYSGFWKQGGEFWIAQAFAPFWKALNDGQKAAYIEKWQASPEWREWLELGFMRGSKG